MRTAVVLSSYNGEKYIYEQLLSLKNQTRKADRVYISDDGSTDSTVQVIQSFIEDNELSTWSLVVNDNNKGWKKNFHDLILSAEEEIIFPCDQDDVWYPEKISEMAKLIEQNEKINLLACGYDAKYEDGTRHISNRITSSMKNDCSIHNVSLSEVFMDVQRPGCAFAVRKSFCDAISDSWDDLLPHDAMLWRCAVISGSAYLYDRNLFMWRRYDTSSSNPNKNLNLYSSKYELLYSFYIDCFKSHLLFLDCAEELIDDGILLVNGNHIDILVKSRDYENAMLNAFVTKKVLSFVFNSVKYSKYSPSLKSTLWKAFVIFKTK